MNEDEAEVEEERGMRRLLLRWEEEVEEAGLGGLRFENDDEAINTGGGLGHGGE